MIKYKRFDLARWIQLSFINDCKILQEAKSLDEYFDKANTGLYEFLNPGLAYNYEEVGMSDGQKMWKIEKQDNDPIMVITLKKQGLENKYWVLDFYFPELRFAIELNGITHYEPIYGENKFEKIKNNDKRKVIACYEKEIELAIIDSSTCTYLNESAKNKFKNLVFELIEKVKNRKPTS